MLSMITPVRVLSLAAILSSTAVAQVGGVARSPVRGPAPKPAGPRDASLIVLQQRPDFVLWDADKEIEPGTVGLVYLVEQVDRFRLLLTAPAYGLRGWTPSGAVISLKQSEEFFTQAIVINPN